MYIKGFMKIDKCLVKNFKINDDGTTILHTKRILANGKNECWILDTNAEIIDDGKYIIVKLAEVKPCKK